jgi:hypothetical protein
MGAFVFSAPSLLEIADIPDAFSRNRSQAWTGTGQNAVAAFDRSGIRSQVATAAAPCNPARIWPQLFKG